MLDRIQHGDILELRLNRAPVNALDPALVCKLRDEVAAAPNSGARALIISGREGMYSAGLDVAALLQLDRKGIQQFFGDFFGMLKAVAESPIPIAAAITGHSPAGGAVLSIFADYRVMAEGEFRFGFNEVAVGLVVPEPVRIAITRAVGAERSERLCVEASLLKPPELLRLGLVHEVVPMGQVVAQAKAWCERMLAFPPRAMGSMRKRSRQDLVAAFDGSEQNREMMADVWFGEETQAALRQLLERLKAPRKG